MQNERTLLCFSCPTECGSCTFRAAILALSSLQAGVCAFGLGGGLEAWGRVDVRSTGQVGCQNWLDGSSGHSCPQHWTKANPGFHHFII